MKRLVLLMIAAASLVWAGVLLDFGSAHSGKSRARDAAPPPAPAPPAPDPHAVRTLPRPQPASTLPQAKPAPGLLPARAPASAKLVAAAAAQRAIDEGSDQNALRGEHGEGALSPEYAELEHGYANESRDGAWALAEEQTLNQLLRASPVRDQLALVNCVDRTCRIVLETDSNDAFQQLLAVPGLAQHTGLHAGTPYSLRAGQLSVFLRRRE